MTERYTAVHMLTALRSSYIDRAGGTVIGRAGDDSAARARLSGHMRASDAHRERVIDVLKAAYVYGLVTKDEFDARVTQTLASRTYADLAAVTADIPSGLAAAPATLSPAPARAKPAARTSLLSDERPVVTIAAAAGLALIVGISGGTSVAGQVALGAALEFAVASLLLAVVQMLAHVVRRQKV